MINYAAALKTQRELNGYSQNALAKATGISQPKISYYELGQHSPPIEFCAQLAQFYGITIDELVGLSENPVSKQPVSAMKQSTPAIEFANEYADLICDKSFIQTAKLFEAVKPELRALALGYIVGLLQSNGINTRDILGY